MKSKLYIAALIISMSLPACNRPAKNIKEEPVKQESCDTIKTKKSAGTTIGGLCGGNSEPRRNEKGEVIYDITKEMPSFPGGADKLKSYFEENLQYPAIDKQNGTQGRVICQFIVNKDGSISNIVVARSLSPTADKESIRIIESMPKWIPGKHDGKNVNILYTVGIYFRLPPEPTPKDTIAEVDTTRVYEAAEVMPSFPGGNAALMNHIQSHLKYPTLEGCEQGTQGRFIGQFVVNRDGSISDIVVKRSLTPTMDKEALRVIQSMPKWIPGKQDGVNVKVRYAIPIVFGIQ
jgi:TonB family protein